MKKEVVEREKEGINPPKKPDYLKIKPVDSETDKLKNESLPKAQVSSILYSKGELSTNS